MPRPSSRELILDAYEDVLIEGGPSSVTLESVARRADVSKGGLLYHFGSKEALLDGLLRRLTERDAHDMAEARRAPSGVIRYYLRTSASDAMDNNALHRTFVAAVRLVLDDPRVQSTLRQITQRWRELIEEETGDPLAASLVTVLGDGLALHAVLGVENEALMSSLDEVVSRLVKGEPTGE